MMNNSNLTSLSSLEAREECYGTCNETAVLTSNSSGHNVPGYTLQENIRCIIIFLICCFGLVGNGNVIWLLGFRMKRNPFTTYILNLAVADFGVLLCLIMHSTVSIVDIFRNVSLYSTMVWAWLFFHLFFFSLYSISQLLLAVISIDRCVSVLFPIWHRCHRPTHLSTTVCALIWGISSLLFAIHVILLLFTLFSFFVAMDLLCIVTGFLCLPLMAISSLILFIKVCFKSKKNHRRRILITILLTLLFYLIFAFPLSVACFIFYFAHEPSLYKILFHYIYVAASFNSSVNPLIYFLVGRKKKSQSRQNMKAILQRVFKEEEENMESAV